MNELTNREVMELLERVLQPVKILQTERRRDKVVKKWVLSHYILSMGSHQYLMETLSGID